MAFDIVNVNLGENIDGRVCETLEEIFRRVRFRCIDLEATSLDEEVGFVMYLSFLAIFYSVYIAKLLLFLYEIGVLNLAVIIMVTKAL